jgi:hypothetical protein
VALFLAAAGSAQAQSGQPYQLDWNVPGEELVYRSCGCADSCWVAEVRRTGANKSANQSANPSVKATLRCDCEKLLFSEAQGRERVVSDSCGAFDGVGKMDLIPRRIKELQAPTSR